ncbi:MAG: hypothetical protein ACK5OX_15985 [Desertimonas sp.]
MSCLERTSARHRRTSLSAQLDREWAMLRRRPEALVAAARWRVVEPLEDLDDVLVAVGHRAEPSAERDARLAQLVGHARTDQLAARVVLQRLVPGLLGEVRRQGRRDRSTVGAFEELVGHAWIVIRVAALPVHTPCVAARLVDAARYRAFVAPRRRRSFHEVVVDPSKFAETPASLDPTAFEELAALLGEAREHGLDRDDLVLMRDLMRAESPAALARAREVTPRTIRNHRDRAVHSIRQLTEAGSAA